MRSATEEMTLQDVGLPDAAVEELIAWFENDFRPRFLVREISEASAVDAYNDLAGRMRLLLVHHRLPADLLTPVVRVDPESGDMDVSWSMNSDHMH